VDQLADRLRQRALAEGFDLVGIARAGVAAGAGHLRSWLEGGLHADMDYMQRTASLRADPRLLLPGCRSVVAVALSYHTSHPSSFDRTEEGRVWVSRYAWGRDYHRLVKKRLIRIGRWLEHASGGCAWRACVDTAPVLERDWAATAGLGWRAKNTMLLNRHLGSELFLGVLLTDVELPPDRPATAHCGRCTACLDACPTGAFPRPGVLDARRCVGYLTVEHRTEIPRILRSGIGGNVAGCDICQEVCPWNRRAPADLHPELQPAPHRFNPRLDALQALGEQGYREWRRGSPLNRIPFRQFRHTLEVVAANLCER
jgi:epoxyqueuosine reductase